MTHAIVNTQQMQVVALTTRTKNSDEMNSNTQKIAPLVGQYFGKNLASKINHKNPQITIDGFTDYESNENGEYTYFIGAEAIFTDNIPAEFKVITIPAGKYVKLTTPSGERAIDPMNTIVDIFVGID